MGKYYTISHDNSRKTPYAPTIPSGRSFVMGIGLGDRIMVTKYCGNNT